MAAENPKDTPTQEPPKKKQKRAKKSFWLVKVPTWVAEEWFNDKKYPNGSRLADLYVIPPKAGSNKKKMKLEITRPPPSTLMNSNSSMHSLSNSNSNLNAKNNPFKQFEDIPIPQSLKVTEREQRTRVNVKHGELTQCGVDKLLVFHDKPAFPVGSKVEALDNSRNNRSRSSFGSTSDDEDNEDDDITMKDGKKSKNGKKKGDKDNAMTTLKGYAKGVIKEINDNRTFTVEFNKTKKLRYNVPERDIRFIDPNEAQRANRCKIQGSIKSEMDVTPQWTPQYKEFLQIRAMKKSMQNTMKIKERVDIYALDEKKRNDIAQKKIAENKRDKGRKGSKGKEEKKPKRVKNVRKEEQQYKNMIFAAFEKDSCLSQKQIELKCIGEPWTFLRPIVNQLCDRAKGSGSGRHWVLKPEYRLATDTAIDPATLMNDE